jgi:class 3 adenylate cyclase
MPEARTEAEVRRSSGLDPDLLSNIAVPLPSVTAAGLVYFYFNYVDRIGVITPQQPLLDLGVFVLVTGTLSTLAVVASAFYFRPVLTWLARLRAGADASQVPPAIRRRAVNGPFIDAVATMVAWTLAGSFYFPYNLWTIGRLDVAWRVFAGIVFVGGPVASVLSFLVAEFFSRRRIPLFFPDGHIDRTGVIRVPILLRLGATFFVTAVLPPLLMMMVSMSLVLRLWGEMPEEIRPLWAGLLRTQIYIVGATGAVSFVMSLLVTRFINRPVQALRAGMTRVAAADLDVLVPVRSTDELGELNERFNAMVKELRAAARLRDVFGRYVPPAVGRQALERGIALGGAITRATAMFVDLRGFTPLSERLPATRIVELLNEYYALVERVCEGAGGIITQFLGDGVVIVYGGPLQPFDDHAHRAVEGAVLLQRALVARNGRAGGEPLIAGIGICTGDVIAGNVGTGRRVTYTIVGDAVNQASRLQVLSLDLGASILLTESTRVALAEQNGFALRPLGALPLKGIAEPVPVYAVEV